MMMTMKKHLHTLVTPFSFLTTLVTCHTDLIYVISNKCKLRRPAVAANEEVPQMFLHLKQGMDVVLARRAFLSQHTK